MRAFFFVLLFTQLTAGAVTGPPTLLRACFNLDDSIVTVYWTPINDACGSFTKLSLYGNEMGGPFSKIDEIMDVNATSYSFKTSNLETDRNFYVTIYHLCNLTDSAQSPILDLDDQRPTETPLDSVSYDFNTQNIIAGWRPNTDHPDVKGYRILRTVGGISDSIGETSDTFFTVTTNPNNVFNVSLSTIDSCGLYSIIKDEHRVSRLSSSIDTCKREITLNWSLYKGWTQIDSQKVFVQKNFGAFSLLQTLNGSDNSLIFNNFILGDTLCFYLRSYSPDGFTSSSNRICVETRAFHIPTYVYIDYVTVVNDAELEIAWRCDDIMDVSTYDIQQGLASGPFSSYSTEPSTRSTTYSQTHLAGIDVHSNFYSYQINALNQCNEIVASSQIANSIFLDISNGLRHNPYVNWDGGTKEYVLFRQAPESSTWNASPPQASPFFYNMFDSAGCYYVLAYEDNNSYGIAEQSMSNIQCINPEFKVFMPNSMVMGGVNNRFIVKGTGIDHSNSSYQIFNRWGEKLVDNNTSTPWYGDYMGEPVMPGVYVYVVTAISYEGEKQMFKGVIRVIESAPIR